ncbi:MAG: HEAT repeat domain-containing protein [Candidatus Riflebacteria bacterium]|nr:HEAT repeat domain-containing protein [Candidatus Riflebacteria bacterium]
MIWPFDSAISSSELITQLMEGSPADRKTAFAELSNIEDPEADKLILNLGRSLSSPDPDIVISMIDLIGIRKIEAGVDFLRPFSSDENQGIRLSAIRSLIKIQSQTSLDILIPLLNDENLEIRKVIHEALVNDFGDNATGALLRAVPEDKNSQFYFEVVLVLEEIHFFEKAKEMFASNDLELKKFQFQNMVRFHRPDFLSHFMDLAESGGNSIQMKLRKVLAEYSTEELEKPFTDALRNDSGKTIIKLIEDVLINRNDSRAFLVKLAAGIKKRELRSELINKVLRKMDTTTFLPALSLIYDPVPVIRAQVIESLVNLAQQTNRRLEDPNETNLDFLREQVNSWVEELKQYILVESHGDILGDLGKILFEVVSEKYQPLLQVLPHILNEAPMETMKNILGMHPDSRKNLIIDSLKNDSSIASIYNKALTKLPHIDIFRPLIECIAYFSREDRENFKKLLLKPLPSFKLGDLLNDSQPHIRLATLKLIAETNYDLMQIIEEKTSDPDPQVRMAAIGLALERKHPKLLSILENACVDPASEVVIKSLNGLKEIANPAEFPGILSRAVNHPSDEVRFFALKEIAKITQARYIQNFRNLSPEIRKLAGSAISKLDGGFVDRLITELKSLDPETRLRAVLIIENLNVTDKATDALLSAMRDPSKKVRAAIVKTLGIIGNYDLLGKLVEFLSDPDDRVRANSIEAITGIGKENALSIILPFLDDPNNRIRANAALAVWQIGRIDIFPVLNKMLVSSDIGMRASALWVLGETKIETMVNLIFPFIKDLNDMVRFNAIRALGKIKPELLKPLIPQLRRDSSNEIKRFITEISYKII